MCNGESTTFSENKHHIIINVGALIIINNKLTKVYEVFIMHLV